MNTLDSQSPNQKRPNTLKTGKKGSNSSTTLHIEDAGVPSGSMGRSKSNLRFSDKRQTLELPNSLHEDFNHSLSVIAENENEKTVVISTKGKINGSVRKSEPDPKETIRAARREPVALVNKSQGASAVQDKLRTLKKNNGRRGHMQSTSALPRVEDAAPLVAAPAEPVGKPPLIAPRFSDSKAKMRAEPLSMMSTLDQPPRSDLSSALPEVLSLKNESTGFETLSRTSAITIGSRISPASTYNSRKLRIAGGYATSGSGEDQTKYLQQSELTPLINPDFEWKICMEEIRSSDWSKQFEACNTLRRVCAHHAELITSSNIRTISSSLQV